MSYESELTTLFENYFEGVDPEATASYIKELEVLIKKIVKSSSSSSASKAAVSKTKSAPKASAKKTGSDGEKEKAKRPYAQFVKFCTQYAKNRDSEPVNIMVTPGDNYKKKDTKSYIFFDANLQDMVDVEMTFDDMFQRVHGEVEPGGGAMRTAGICWGLLSKDSQEEILATME